mmetsp:Transcript_50736/g.118933  ORF Transcript_50736/g.118933 Transcript_50736/m.118933 type:complete len:250 (+) Transcript_50736:126-875(+)
MPAASSLAWTTIAKTVNRVMTICHLLPQPAKERHGSSVVCTDLVRNLLGVSQPCLCLSVLLRLVVLGLLRGLNTLVVVHNPLQVPKPLLDVLQRDKDVAGVLLGRAVRVVCVSRPLIQVVDCHLTLSVESNAFFCLRLTFLQELLLLSGCVPCLVQQLLVSRHFGLLNQDGTLHFLHQSCKLVAFDLLFSVVMVYAVHQVEVCAFERFVAKEDIVHFLKLLTRLHHRFQVVQVFELSLELALAPLHLML